MLVSLYYSYTCVDKKEIGSSNLLLYCEMRFDVQKGPV